MSYTSKILMGFLFPVTKNNGTSPQNENRGKFLNMDYFCCSLNPEYLLFRHYNLSLNPFDFFLIVIF